MWKSNWEETKRHFIEWWNGKGLVVGMWGAPRRGGSPREAPPEIHATVSPDERYLDAGARVKRSHAQLACEAFPADVLPVLETDMGPGSLAFYLGATPEFTESTVWFRPAFEGHETPESLPALSFDPHNRWWRLTEATLRAAVELARGRYLVGCPDLVEGIDVLASLRGAETLLMDMVDRPEWVEQKLEEIKRAWFEAYRRVYEIIRLEDGSSAFGAFRIWGPGKTAKLQCDAGAMISPEMFRRFAVPGLRAQCRWLDHSVFHLDGTQALCHLDALLEIGELNAVEWTPQDGIEGGGDRRWFPLYRKILDAGKSVQAVGVQAHEVAPLLDALGGAGMYILTTFRDEEEGERMAAAVDRYR